MPTYRFFNKETDEEFEMFLSISGREEFLNENPHITQIITPVTITTMTGSLDSKTDDSWKEVLSKVAEAHPGSQVAERYGRKSIKQVKTENVVKKHAEKQAKERRRR